MRATSAKSHLEQCGIGLVLACLAAAGAGCGGSTNGEDVTAVESPEGSGPGGRDARGRSRPSPLRAASSTPVEATPDRGSGGTPAQAEPRGPGAGRWVEVRPEPLRVLHPTIGIFGARQTTRLGPQVSGRVEEVLVDVGDRVTRDQILLRLDATFFDIDVALRQADLDAALASLEDAALNLRRMTNLWEKPEGTAPSIARKVFDEARTRHDAALARKKQAEESLRDAREHLEECRIRSPFDGVVTQRLVDTGESVNSAPVTHLLEVAEVGALELEFSLPQAMLSTVRVGTPVSFRVEGIDGTEGSGAIAMIYPRIDEATRTFRSRVVLEDGASRYMPGMLVRVEVLLKEIEAALAVPRTALSRSNDGWRVLTTDGGEPKPADVTIGLEQTDRVQVVEGLAPGSLVWVPESGSADSAPRAPERKRSAQ